MNNQVQVVEQKSPFAVMAGRLSVDPATVENLILNTLMTAKDKGGQVTHDEVMVFMSIANEYRLNPLTKEIYAFNNRGAIQPIVSIDGWLRIINSNPQYDGVEFDDKLGADGQIIAITCRIYRKDRSKPTEVTEYLAECAGTSVPWQRWPVRMLRHKALIQAARYAFGLSGIMDEDEADRIRSTMKNITPGQEWHISQAEAEELESRANKIGDFSKILGFFGADNVMDLTETQYKKALASIEKKEAESTILEHSEGGDNAAI